MATKAMPSTRLQYRTGALGAAVDALAESMGLAEGEELELRQEDGRIVVEVVRPKILAPVSDVAGRADRNKRVAEAIDEVMRKHEGAFALLAR